MYCPSPKRCPPKVEEITEGKRATREIYRNSVILISVSPAKYVIRSFGVPGIKNRMNIKKFRFLEVFMNLSSFIFSLETNTSTNRIPKRRVRKKIKADAAATPA